MSETTFGSVKLETKGEIAQVCLNRPEMRNAFEPTMIDELTGTFKALAKRGDLRAIVLRGEGKSFCSGADLGYMKSMAGYTLEENEKDSLRLFDMFAAIRACHVPVIGRIHGHAMGGALGLTAVCDIAAAVDGTQFCFSEVRLGLAPAVISPFVLEKMSPGAAYRYMLSAEVFGTSEALQSGLIQFAGSESEVDSFISKTTSALSANGPEAVRATKELLRGLYDTPDWESRKAMTTKVISERRVSDEGQEGLRSFLEKRAPTWKAKTEDKS